MINHSLHTYHCSFSYFLLLYATKSHRHWQGPRSWGGRGGQGLPHFLPQTQFLTAFLGHRVNKSCKVTRTVTKIWWPNRRKSHFQSFSFQNFPGPIRSDPSRWIARSALEDGSPHSKLRSAVADWLCCVMSHVLFACRMMLNISTRNRVAKVFLKTGSGAKLYLGPLWCHYFQTTRLETGEQYSKALRIALTGALNVCTRPDFSKALLNWGPHLGWGPGASPPPYPVLSAALISLKTFLFMIHKHFLKALSHTVQFFLQLATQLYF